VHVALIYPGERLDPLGRIEEGATTLGGIGGRVGDGQCDVCVATRDPPNVVDRRAGWLRGGLVAVEMP
jgi:hypothetical protein